MTAGDPHFFVLLILGSAVAYGLMPAIGMAWIMLACLWLFASHPLIAMMLAALWLLRTPLRWVAEAFIVGLAGGLGARLSGAFNSPERAERLREKWRGKR